jgi:aerobic-type carbon monoxide dehydrogenase small subunit (CoxS/CutS family)
MNEEKFSLNINGDKKVVEIDPSTPMLWVLRDELKLTGTKFGCGRGLCGACTIHLNDVEIRSCQTSIDSLEEDDQITTIEGLSIEGDHPVQKAWISNDVPQCGYCQSGQIMTASALLKRNKNPDDEDINNAMKMNICRCGTYQRVRKAIHTASKEIKNG